MHNLDTKIREVTVFPDRARVMRSGTITVDAGTQTLRVGPLPLTMDPESLRASAHGTVHATLHGVDVRRETYSQSPADEVRELERAIELLETQLSDVEAQIVLATEERTSLASLLQNTAEIARGIAFGKLTADAHMELVERVRTRCAALDAQKHELHVTHRELERAIQKPRREIERLQSATAVERYVAFVEVEAAGAGELVVEISSLMRDASWSPVYDLRVSEGDKPALTVDYMGQVVQRTGESWEGVTVVLSTARPARSGSLPELVPWYIAQRRSAMEGMDMAAKSLPQGFAMAADLTTGAEPECMADEVKSAEVAMAKVEASGSAVTYRIPGMATIPSDGSSHKVTVARVDLTPHLDYVTTPKLTEDVFRRAKVTNDSPYVFLAGSAHLFSGEDFVGRTSLDHIPQGGRLELFLGVCDQVTVTRELTKREVDRTFIGNRTTLSLGYKMKVENRFPSEVRVVIRDQIPVPRNEEIKARLEAAEPQPAQRDDMGLLTWELSIPGGGSQVVTFRFAIEHPRQMEVAGLP